MDDVLKPCPFCGGVGCLTNSIDIYGEVYDYGVECQNYPCNAEISGWDTPEAAVEAWNRRVNDG